MSIFDQTSKPLFDIALHNSILGDHSKEMDIATRRLSDIQKLEVHYRIIKKTSYNGRILYAVQKHRRLFGIGPRVWLSYKSLANHYSDDYGFFVFGTQVIYYNIEHAREAIKSEIDKILSKTKYTEVIKYKYE